MSLQSTLAAPIDALLSLRSTPATQASSLTSLEHLLITLTDPSESLALDAFLILQDGFEYNLVGRLLEWLGRRLGDAVMGSEEMEMTRSNMARCLSLIQGLLLLHRRSQRLFARRASLEYLLAILTLSQSSTNTTPLQSPTFPPSPSPSSHSSSSQRSTSSSSPPTTPLALVVLDTLLCALVDRPRNVRTFEEVGGLGSVVGVLRDKSAVQVVRIKAIEILYYYLLPESPSSTRRNASDTSTTSSTSSAASAHRTTTTTGVGLGGMEDFVPQTPTKPRPSHHLHPPASPTPSSSSNHDRRSRDEFAGRNRRSPSQSPSRPASSPSIPPSPSTSTRVESNDGSGTTPRAARRDRKPLSLHPNPLPPPPISAPLEAGSTSNGGNRGRRTESEKRELLRGYMGNVERLEERFRAMGLGGDY